MFRKKDVENLRKSFFKNGILAEMASRWDFFGIPNPESRSRGFRIGIFYFGLDQKIPKMPKSRGSGWGFKNPEKIPKEKSRKCRNPGDRDRDLKIPKKSRKKNPENAEIPGIGTGILKPLKNPEKIPRAKSQKSQNSGDRDRDLKIPK